VSADFIQFSYSLSLHYIKEASSIDSEISVQHSIYLDF